MGLSPVELAGLTPYQFDLKYKGYVEGKDAEEMYFMKLARIIVALQADPNKPLPPMSEIWPTHYDVAKDKQELVVTKKNLDASIAAWKKNRNK